MDCFKLKPGIAQVSPIATDVFLKQTRKRAPYYVQDHKGKEHCYAVCPECDNPIQVVGLFKDTIEAGKKPYGRHNKGDIPGLALYCEEDYLNCSYSDPKWQQPNARRGPRSRLSKEVLQLMYEQYDRVIYVLAKDMEIRISFAMAQRMLQTFMAHEAWSYRMATLNNLPWILGKTMPSTPLYGQRILKGGELYRAIEALCPTAQFKETDTKYAQLIHKPGQFLDVQFFFLGHEKRLEADGQHLEESIEFAVTSGEEYIYQRIIPIRTEFFLNLIHLPDTRAHRREEYLKIAHQLIDPALFKDN